MHSDRHSTAVRPEHRLDLPPDAGSKADEPGPATSGPSHHRRSVPAPVRSTRRMPRTVAAVVLLACTAAACSGTDPEDGIALGVERVAVGTTDAGAGPASSTTAPTTSTVGAVPATTEPVPADMQPLPTDAVRPGATTAGRTTTPGTAGNPNPPATNPPAAGVPSGPRPANGSSSSLGRCALFPASSYWYADVSTLPVHANSANYVASIGATGALKADFGSGLWDGGPIGIPYVVVPAGQAKVPMSFEYAAESDPGPYPIPPDAPIEGGPASDGDRHILVVDETDCRLYETYAAYPDGAGWRAGSGAVWDLSSNALRPAGWTSADAAGLPILPGLVRYDEVAAGAINHAIRITVPRTQRAYVWPARHFASSRTDANLPPMGLWLRLRAGFDTSGFPREAQVILDALKRHGAIVADNGSAWYLSGAPDERWNNSALATLRRVPGSAFEAVDTSSLVADPNSGRVS